MLNLKLERQLNVAESEIVKLATNTKDVTAVVTRNGSGYVVSQNAAEITSDGDITDVAPFGGGFLFVDDSGYIIFADMHNVLAKYEVPNVFAEHVGVSPRGILLCRYGCALYSLKMRKIWEFELDGALEYPVFAKKW